MSLETEKNVPFLENMIKLVESYGLIRIFKAILVLFVFLFVVYNTQNSNQIIDKIIERNKIEHNNALEYRKQINPEVDRILSNLLINSEANRAFVIEMHNGTNNMSGLPFYYGEMTYEKVTPTIKYISDEYTNMTLSRFTFTNYIYEHHSWYGDMDEMLSIDGKLANMMKENNVSYMVFSCIHGSESAIGYVGVTYCNGLKPKDVYRSIGYVNLSAQKLSSLLDMKQVKR